jgi:glucokinase
MTYYIGIDMGGTNLKAGMVDPDGGAVACELTAPTFSYEGPQAVMKRMGDLVLQVIAASGRPKSEFGGVGIGLPGVLDLEKGLTLFLPNLPGTWPNVPIRDTLGRYTGLPVSILNDVRAITFGEWRFGAGRGVETMACFAIGTGVGGGLVINGKLHLGIGGTAGELGHMSIDLNGPVCGCGNRGCLEVYASGPAIAGAGIKAVVQGLTTSLRDLSTGDLNKITAALVYQAAVQGDPIASEIYTEAGNAIGVAAANMCVAIGPRRIVIGGGVSRAGDLLLEPIRKALRERVHVMPVDQVEVVLSSLGNKAGVTGAALWAAENA